MAYSNNPNMAYANSRSYSSQSTINSRNAYNQQQNPFDEAHAVAHSPARSVVDMELDAISPRESTFGGGTRRSHKHEFKSYRLVGKYEQPWAGDPRMKRTKYNNIIVWVFIFLALCLAGFLVWNKSRLVIKHDYCLILEDNFKTLDAGTWNHEVQINGFGTGSFDWTTDDSKNSYVDAEGLHIVPTLTTQSTPITESQLLDGYTLNITKAGGDGSCTATSDTVSACSRKSNSTLGVIIPPVRSARLNTKGKKSIKYGRVEVVAKLGTGDWTWPAIWLMPDTNAYGDWPASGEIDIMEARGNGPLYSTGGKDVFTSTLHWGPSALADAYWRTTAGKALRRTDYTKAYHTFGIEWSDKYLFTYLDSRIYQVLYVDFQGKKDMWAKGAFGNKMENQTLYTNPWAKANDNNAPFDQEFFLILNVAVGSRNGWFPDGIGNKPWVDAGPAAAEFYKAKDKWLPTWGEGASRGMTVKSVKMWQEGACK